MAEARAATIIGNGAPGACPDGPFDANARIAEPFGVAVGPDGWLYFCDLGNHRIRRVDPAGRTVETVVGSGNAGNAGDGGLAIGADIEQPYELRFDGDGNLVFVDMTAHVVRRVDAESRRIETVAGTGEAGFSGDGGPATEAMLRQPHSIEIAGDGAILIADIGNHRIRRVDAASGAIDTFAGTGEQAPTESGGAIGQTPLNGPRSLAFDDAGDRSELYLTLREGNAVLCIDMRRGTVEHLAGNGQFGYEGDGGDARAAKLAGPKGIALSGDDIYIADTESHTVRRINRATGRIDTVLGDGENHDGPDGDPLRCGLARPHGVYVASDGRVFVGDTDNHRVRVLGT